MTVMSGEETSQVVEGSIRQLPDSITLETKLSDQSGRLNSSAKAELEDALRSSIHRIGGGSSKEVYTTEDNSKVVLLANTDNNAAVLGQIDNQIRFYGQHAKSRLFGEMVVGAETIIRNEAGTNLGMVQPKFGVSVTEYKRAGGRLTPEQIAGFTSKYQDLIRETGHSHGDLVSGRMNNRWVVNWDNIHIDPASKTLKFLDYNGRNGAIASGSDTLRYTRYPISDEERQINEMYLDARDSEPARLKEELTRFLS